MLHEQGIDDVIIHYSKVLASWLEMCVVTTQDLVVFVHFLHSTVFWPFLPKAPVLVSYVVIYHFLYIFLLR